MRVLRGGMEHVDLAQLKLAVDVGCIHRLETARAETAAAALLAAPVTALIKPFGHDAHALLAGGVFDEDALGHF